MELIGLRMRTGEDVCGELVDSTDSTVTLRRPLVPITRPETDNSGNQTGREVLHFIKWMPFAVEEEFAIFKDTFVCEPYSLPKEIEDAYLEVTSSIRLAKPGQMPK